MSFRVRLSPQTINFNFKEEMYFLIPMKMIGTDFKPLPALFCVHYLTPTHLILQNQHKVTGLWTHPARWLVCMDTSTHVAGSL